MSVAIAKVTMETLMTQISVHQRVNIERLLPKHMEVDRFLAQVRFAIAKNRDLLKCSQFSVIESVLCAAELGLNPTGMLGSSYLVPYKDKCQLIIGYRGLVDLAHRSGQLKDIYAHNVHERDEFDYQEGLKPKLHHKPKLGDRGPVIASYSVAVLTTNARHQTIMSLEEMEKIRARAPGSKSSRSPWNDPEHILEMYKKCPVRRGAKMLPLNPERARDLGRALEIEESNEAAYDDEEDSKGSKASQLTAKISAAHEVIDVLDGETEEQAAERQQEG